MARGPVRRRSGRAAPLPLRSVVAAALASAWPAVALGAAFVPGQAQVSVDTQSGGGDASADAVRMAMAPIRYWGLVAVDLRTRVLPDSGRSTGQTVSATLNGATFVWQPWFLQVNGSLGGVASWDQSERSGDSESLGGIGSLNLALFPTSRFPFTLYADVNDSRASGDFTDIDYRSHRFRVSQSYSPRFGNERYFASYEQSRLETVNGDGFGGTTAPAKDELKVLNLAASGAWQRHSLDGTVSVSRNEREEGELRQRTRLDFANLQHAFLPGRYMALNSNLSYTRTAIDAPSSLTLGVPLPGSSTSSDFTQLSSYATFRPSPGSRFHSDPDRLLGTATFRAFDFGNEVNGEGGRSRGATGNLAFNYTLSPQAQLYSSTQFGYLTGEIEASSIVAQTFGATYGSDPIPLGRYLYTWSVGGSGSVGVVSGGPDDGLNHLTQVTASHSLNRPLDLAPGAGALRLGLSQSLGYSYGSRADGSGVLTNTATLFWNAPGTSGMQAFAGFTASDARRSGEFGGYYQLLNAQANAQMSLTRWSSLQGGLTLQATRSKDDRFATRPYDPYLDSVEGDWRTSYSAQVAYSHARAFGVPRLLYTALFQASSWDYDSRALGNVDAPLFKVDWMLENRLEYRIGRVLLLGLARWADVQNRGTSFAVFVRAQRSFGAL